ncbi:unnamed protein product [Clonostachys rhizophaga]|uniref:Uncharacterized protein n=1 Tax=Clonostachys rhizophaga TaxID=160324 RepID=A0A9N9VM14_9HYPO|nr:unnamed protein product [Clonostachys rhizophaga]
MPLNKDPSASLDDQLISDEATTQENSPRRPSPQKPQVFDTTTNDLNRDPTSQSETLPKPVHQESLRIPGQSAVVSWFNQQHQETILSHDVASAFIQHDAKPKNTAFFRLRVKVGQTSRRTAKHVYLFIPPEHIQSLSLHDETDTPQAGSKTKAAIRRAVGTAGVSCLSFEMRKPCLLVGPKDLDHSAQSNENQSSHFVNMLDTVKQLSSQRTFVVYLPRTTIPNGPLLSLCQAVSSPGLLASDPTLNDINGLYGGRGGVIIGQRSNDAVIPPAHRFEPQHGPTDEGLPPAYEHTGPAPPPVFTALHKGQLRQAGSKRRRTASSEIPTPATSSKCPAIAVEQPSSTTLDMIMARMEQGFGQINTRLTDIELRIGGIESRLTQLESQSSRHPQDENLDDLRYDLERQIGELREEAEDLLENRVEEGIADAKRELTDYMEDQVDDAKGDIMRKLAESSVQCSINFDFR